MMSTHDEAVQAVNGLNGYNLNGNTIGVSRSLSERELSMAKKQKVSKYDEIKKRELRIVNLDQNVTEQELVNAFSGYGGIEFVKIFNSEYNPKYKNRIVCFSSENEQISFLRSASSISIRGKNCHVSLE